MICGVILMFSLMTVLIIDDVYKTKLETELKLAKIAAGQVVEDDHHNKCK